MKGTGWRVVYLMDLLSASRQASERPGENMGRKAPEEVMKEGREKM